MNSLQEIQKILHDARRVLIVAHQHPDGDTLGSSLGLAWALRKLGLEARLSCADPVPPDLRFLPGSEAFAPRSPTDEDAVFVIDASDPDYIGDVHDAAAFGRLPVINIDHHVTNQQFGTVNWVRPTAATAELILELITRLGVPLDRSIATSLLTGIVTDTRCFRTRSTTPDTLRAAVTLMEANAPLADITDAVYNHRPLATLRVWGPCLTQAQLTDGILWTELPRELLERAGGDEAASEGLTNFLSTIEEARVAVLLRELNGRVDVSLRSASPEFDVSGVAASFGGGGHRQAAGCTIEGSLASAREQVLKTLRQMMAAHTA